MTGMTGQPKECTIKINRGSAASYLMRTPHVPLFVPIFTDVEAKVLLDLQGRRGITSVVRWNLRLVIHFLLQGVSRFASDSAPEIFSLTRPSSPKKQPKHKVFGRDIPGTSGTQTSGYPGQKLYARGLFLLF